MTEGLAAIAKEATTIGMNILVTGSSGWLGQTLVPRLVR